MNELVERFLQPVSAAQPCGPDLSDSGRFDELETILKGKPEVDFGNIKKPAEPPDWRELQQKSAAYLAESKHLRVANMLCCSMLKSAGLQGFRDGLQLLRGLIEQFWGSLHPSLDPEDNNDPTYRLNILSSLTAPRGSVTGWLTFMDYLYSSPLCSPKGAAPVTYELLQSAKLALTGTEGSSGGGPGLDALVPVLRAGATQIAENSGYLQESLEAVQGLDRFLTSTLSAGKSMSFDELENTLQGMLSAIQPYLPVGGQAETAGSEVSVTTAAEAQSGTTGQAVAISGSIRSRADVVNTLDKVCQYYDQVEPGSPVPYLLRRAQKLANMNFVQAVQELNLVSDVTALRPSMGSALDGGLEQTPPAG